MPKHGQKLAPDGVDKEHKCGLYVNAPWTRSCTYCCRYCEQLTACVNACKNTPERCGKEVFERSVSDVNDEV
jgi:hypothetical protein